MRITEMKIEKKAILGGSFDPVHMGHINLFHSISTYTDITTLYVIPAFTSAFKQERKTASFSDRMAMLNCALLDYTDLYPFDDLNVVVSDVEGEKGGISYTSETIKALFPYLEDRGKVNFVIGDDILPSLDKWHDYEYLKTHVRFYCFKREESVNTRLDAEIIYFDSPVTTASSTMVREGLKSIVSPSVLEYIEENGLYKDSR